ncbi:MAG: hypothetical protein WCT16_04980 [Candidatus Buchananbacteria bacterium]
MPHKELVSCTECNGKGYHNRGNHRGTFIEDCKVCGGSKIIEIIVLDPDDCTKCNGKGYHDCGNRRGTSTEDCKVCGGSGKKKKD